MESLKSSGLTLVYLLFCCLPVISLSMRRVNPGENVTLQCDLTDPRIHWYRQSPGQLPLGIVYILSSTYTDAWYFNGFGHHYSLAAHNRLFIHNVTAEDSGIYYCARKEGDTLTFHSGIELNVAGRLLFLSPVVEDMTAGALLLYQD
uniref:Ig-like domain-containing protein n=1 Tax=Lepisosteus oculatus TaxID=7918 RepID=W5MYX8_LEPOC